MSSSNADRNLLFGLLALQNDFISREDLVVAASVWLKDKSQRLDEILLERELLDKDEHAVLSQLVRKHLDRHDNDPESSLAAVGAVDAALHEQLRGLGDEAIEKTLVGVSVAGKAEDPYETMLLDASSMTSTEMRYRHLRPHATGGLGRVSVAEDEELHREVALKEIREQYSDDLVSRARFMQEAEITGSLEHPGIVPVYGLGQYADGRPYYAMRFIHGSSFGEEIKRFHKDDTHSVFRASHLELSKLLRRFIDVCNAIEYAHSRGVIHRDLKPDNIMLGTYGETLIVDWGLAKATGRTDTFSGPDASTLRPITTSGDVKTQLGSAMGTPAYMSPEQAAGRIDELGPASDVCSLGAILYCLLTGDRPFTDRATDVVLRKVQGGDFRPLREVKPNIPKPLEAICMKAMALRPKDRYASASALKDEIEHWLADEPVSAYEDSLRERVGRWFRQHRAWAQAAAVALVITATIMVVATVWVNSARKVAEVLAVDNAQLAEDEKTARLEADDQKQQAMERLREARAAVDYWITGGSEALRFYPDVQEARKTLLETAAADYERFAQEQSNDAELETERGRVYLRLGDVYRTLFELSNAENSYRQAEAVFKRFPDNDVCRLELANSRVKLGLVLVDTGRSRDAEVEYLSAIEIFQSLVESSQDQPHLREALATGLLNRGILLNRIDRLTEAEEVIRRTAQMYDELWRGQPNQSRHTAALSKARHVLGRILVKRGLLDDALDQFDRSIEGLDAVLRDESNNFDYLEAHVTAKVDRASVLASLGRNSDQLEAYSEAVGDYGRLAGSLPDVPRYQDLLALTSIELGRLYHRKFYDATQADEHLALAIDYFKPKVPEESLKQGEIPDYDAPLHYEGLGAVYDALGQLYGDLGANDNAQLVFERAIVLFEKLVAGPGDDLRYQERLAISKSHFGELLHKVGAHADAAAQYDSAIKTLTGLILSESSIPRYRNSLALTYKHLGTLEFDRGEREAAKIAWGKALDQWRNLTEQIPAPEYLHYFAAMLVNCPDADFRNPGQAIELVGRATEKAPRNASYRTTLGGAYYRQGSWSDSARSLREAIELRGSGDGESQFFLAMTLARQNHADEAKIAFDAAVTWMDENRPGNLDLWRLRKEAESLLSESGPSDDGAESQ